MQFNVYCPHESLRKPILEKFKELGATNTDSQSFMDTDENYYQMWKDGNITRYHTVFNRDKFKLISLEEFFSIKPNNRFALNEKYEAVFKEDGIQVGCQFFDKDVMVEFANKIIETYTPQVEYTTWET